jgi:hypothetical protein
VAGAVSSVSLASSSGDGTETTVAVTDQEVRRAFAVMRRIARSPYIPVKPTLKQLAYLLADEREVLLTGSGGSGKTVGLPMAALLDIDRPGYRALVVQRTVAGPVTLAELARAWLEGTDASWDSSARVWRFPSAASLDFGHERLMYVAGEYHFVGCDDLTLFSEVEYKRIFQIWRRRQGSTTPMRVRVATSPGGPGHDRVRERFAIDNPASVLPLGRRVVVATMDDNEHLDREEYRRSLANLDPVRRAQLETGTGRSARAAPSSSGSGSGSWAGRRPGCAGSASGTWRRPSSRRAPTFCTTPTTRWARSSAWPTTAPSTCSTSSAAGSTRPR